MIENEDRSGLPPPQLNGCTEESTSDHLEEFRVVKTANIGAISVPFRQKQVDWTSAKAALG